MAKQFPEFSLTGLSQGYVLRLDSAGAYLMPYVAMRFRDYRQLIEYYHSLGRTYDEAAALAAIVSHELDSARCS